MRLLTIDGLNSKDSTLYIMKAAGEIRDNYQINYSMGERIFVNAFQQRLVPMELPGVSVMNRCAGNPRPDATPAFVRFYETNSVVRAKNLVKLTYAGIVLKGYMTSLKWSTLDMQDVDGFSFTLGFTGYLASGEVPEEGEAQAQAQGTAGAPATPIATKDIATKAIDGLVYPFEATSTTLPAGQNQPDIPSLQDLRDALGKTLQRGT